MFLMWIYNSLMHGIYVATIFMCTSHWLWLPTLYHWDSCQSMYVKQIHFIIIYILYRLILVCLFLNLTKKKKNMFHNIIHVYMHFFLSCMSTHIQPYNDSIPINLVENSGLVTDKFIHVIQ